jgi:hypothetical protein
MSGLFGGTPSIPQQPSPQLTSKQVDESAANADEFERRRRAAAKGHQSTILTGGTLGAPQVRRKSLLGGGV